MFLQLLNVVGSPGRNFLYNSIKASSGVVILSIATKSLIAVSAVNLSINNTLKVFIFLSFNNSI